MLYLFCPTNISPVLSDDDDYDDDDNNIESRPSVIINNNLRIINSDTNSDTNSDGYDINTDYIELSRRRPSFIRTSLNSFSSRIRISPGHIKNKFNDKNENNTYCYIITSILFFINCLGLEKKHPI